MTSDWIRDQFQRQKSFDLILFIGNNLTSSQSSNQSKLPSISADYASHKLTQLNLTNFNGSVQVTSWVQRSWHVLDPPFSLLYNTMSLWFSSWSLDTSAELWWSGWFGSVRIAVQCDLKTIVLKVLRSGYSWALLFGTTLQHGCQDSLTSHM